MVWTQVQFVWIQKKKRRLCARALSTTILKALPETSCQDLLSTGRYQRQRPSSGAANFKKRSSANGLSFSTGLKTEVDDLSDKALRDGVNTGALRTASGLAYQSDRRRLVTSGKLAEVKSDAKESIWYSGIMGRVEANPMKRPSLS